MLECLGKDVLKYNTKKSYDYFIQCKDNHKAWQAFTVFLHGTTMELFRFYASSLDVGGNPTALGTFFLLEYSYLYPYYTGVMFLS